MKKYILIVSLLILASCTSVSTPPGNTKNPTTSSPTVVTPKVMIASPTYGSGSHTITLYTDFQCPACIAFSNLVEPILREYAEKGYLTITYKQYPLTRIHPNAERDALAALCSAEQGKFMDYKKALYAMESAKGGAKVTDDDRIGAGKDILDTTRLAECLKNNTYLPQVRAEMAEGDAAGVTGTPTVYLDGKKLDSAVYRDPAVLRTILDRLLGVPASATGATK